MKATKENIKNIRNVDRLSEDLIKTCNKILIKRESDCQCYDDDNYLTRYFKMCQIKQ